MWCVLQRQKLFCIFPNHSEGGGAHSPLILILYHNLAKLSLSYIVFPGHKKMDRDFMLSYEHFKDFSCL